MSGVQIVDPRVLPFGWEEWRAGFVLAHAIAALLLIAVAVGWGRHDRRRYLVASCFLTVSVIAVAYLVAVRASDIPIGWITIIHESLGHTAVRHLYTRGVHAGPNFAFVLSAIAAGPAANLHDVVWLNLLLAGVNAVVFFHVALHIAGPVWAAVWTLVLALNPATFMASFSELPTNLLGLYFLAAVLGWAAATDPLPQPGAIRWSGWVLCALLTLLCGLTRGELAAIGIFALGLQAAAALLGANASAAAQRGLVDACRRALAYLADRPALVVALGALGLYLSYEGLPYELLGRSEVTGIYPFSSTVYTLFLFLPMMLLPVGVGIATFLGFVHATVHFRRFGGLALSLFILVRTYFAGQNQYYEAGRYLSYVFPAIFLLALYAPKQLAAMTSSWRPTWRNAAQVAFLISWFGRPLPGIPDFYLHPDYHDTAGITDVLLDLNMQREVRHLLAVSDENPECVFVGRVIENYARPEEPREYAYAIFGTPVPAAIFVPESAMPLDQVIAKYAPGAACVRLYFGGDCNLTTADRCASFVAGRRLLEEERFWSRPYNEPTQYGHGAPEIVLATYAWP